MPYKSKQAQKEYNKERMRKARRGSTKQGSTRSGSTDRIEFIKKELNDPYLIKDIEGASKMFNDRDARYERAYRYKLWHDGKGSTTPCILEALVCERERLAKVCASLREHKQLDGVMYGCGGLSFDFVEQLLQVTN